MEGITGYKRITIMDNWELVRRLHSGQSIRHIALVLEYARKTLRRYINKLKDAGLTLEGSLPK